MRSAHDDVVKDIPVWPLVARTRAPELDRTRSYSFFLAVGGESFLTHSTTTLTMIIMSLALLSWTLSLVYLAHAADISHNATISKVAFGSCHKNKWAKTAKPVIWPSIASLQPDVFVWTGDAVYPPTRGVASLQSLRDEYTTTMQNVEYANFHPPFGIYGTWDDHDYGANDGGKEVSDKQARKDLFFDFLGYHHLDENREGVYHSVDFGPVGHQIKIILLDTRWHRDAHCIPSVASHLPLGAGIACLTRWCTAGTNVCRAEKATILGEEQWQWLQQELEQSKAQIHVIVSSIQVLTTNPVMESWGHYPAEQRRLLSLLNGVSGAMVWSGDVHHAELLMARNLLEVTSSGLTHTCTKPFYGVVCEPLLKTFTKHRANASDYYVGRNFGMLQVNWEKEEWTVEVHDENATVVLSSGWRAIEPLSVDLDAVPPTMDGHLIPYAAMLLIGVTCVVASFLAGRRSKRRKQKTT